MTAINQHTGKSIPFFEMKAQNLKLKEKLADVFLRVLDSDRFILGEEVRTFEEEFAAYIGARFAVGVASGTDALILALKVLGVGDGDEVITAANTAAPTAVAVSLTGARPVFVDIQPDGFQMDPGLIEGKISPATRAVLPVHLYGQTAPMQEILSIAKKHSLPVIEDACQAHGAIYESKKAGNLGAMGCFSFYPTKNLGCLGDGGMIVLNDEKTYRQLLMLRNYGQKSKYEHAHVGMNSRLDEIQAAVLRVKLKRLDEWNQRRRRIAKLYSENIRNPLVRKPTPDIFDTSVCHLYVIRAKARDSLQKWLAENGVETMIHYPGPLHLQPAFSDLGYEAGALPHTERRVGEILSLPSYPELQDEAVLEICRLINQFSPEEN